MKTPIPAGYPIHWIFDHFPQFTELQRRVALLLFDGKRVAEMAQELSLSPKEVERAIHEIGSSLFMLNHFNLKGIESGTFFKKWGFIRKK